MHPLLTKITENFPELKSSRILLAVSGGLDSTVMAHLFVAGPWSSALAHCNFQLRGKASDDDEHFVRNLAKHWKIPFYSVAFDTSEEAAQKGISTLMAARQLRYDWLERIRKDHAYDFIITAHHLNDGIETNLINQTRGTGIRGLLGIPARHGAVLRPLLVCSRAELEAYASENQIEYREDSSNEKDDYHRNRIRHHVIPVLQSINPSLEETFRRNFEIWSESAYLMEWACLRLKKDYVLQRGNQLRIDFSFLSDHPQAAVTLLYEWVKAYGFHIGQLKQAIEHAGGQPGAVWYGLEYRLLVDRTAFLVDRIENGETREAHFILEGPDHQLSFPGGGLRAELYPGNAYQRFTTSNWIALLDAEKVKFPLSVRHWKAGDVFCPLGMGGRSKKVQDFFTDKKINRFEKEKAWLILSANGDILWIAGHRIDERYKIREETQKMLILRFGLD